MLYLIQYNNNLPYLLAALLIGIATGWWIWRRHRVRVSLKREDGPLQPTLARRTETVPAPAPTPLATPVALRSGGDDLTRLKGVGPKLGALLSELGIQHFHQIAGWSDAEIDAVDARLGQFKGRIRRDRWQEQARLLADGNEEEFARLYGTTGA